MPGQLYIISGPSGVGKSTAIRRLREKVTGLGFSISHTSRAPRSGEKDGVHYRFVAEETFKKMIDEGAFVEWARVYQGYYGTSFGSLEDLMTEGLDVVLDIDTQGGANIREFFKEKSTLIYLLPPSLHELEKRLRGRATDEEAVIDSRLRKAIHDIENCAWYDYLIFNDDLDWTVKEVESIVLSERCRRTRRLSLVEETFKLSLAIESPVR